MSVEVLVEALTPCVDDARKAVEKDARLYLQTHGLMSALRAAMGRVLRQRGPKTLITW